ncbi:MAG: hotdog fold domain-containing protein [Wenzhouxiangellaceae bacterium]|nr:hotdog fold domain-containing protein [Wenzhouxiangellaceae bacterium]
MSDHREKPRNRSHEALERVRRLPWGLWLFSRIVCLKAPYFSTIRPVFEELEPGRARARLKCRRRVTNHLGTVHAIAQANLCEFVAGTMMEISMPREMRWIPRGLEITYLGRTKGRLYASCNLDGVDLTRQQDVPVRVEVVDEHGEPMAEATIPMYISPRKPGRDAKA